MSQAATLIQRVHEAGGQVDVRDGRVRVAAPALLPESLMVALRAQKADIVRLVAATWVERYEERAAIIEHDGDLSREEAEVQAYERIATEWLYEHPAASDPGRCAWCAKLEDAGSVVVPFGTADTGHTWLHHDCWPAWQERRRQHATEALAKFGLRTTNGNGGAYVRKPLKASLANIR